MVQPPQGAQRHAHLPDVGPPVSFAGPGAWYANVQAEGLGHSLTLCRI